MILRIKEKFWPMLLSFLTFYLMFAQFLKIYRLENDQLNFVAIASLCLIAGVIPSRLLKLPLFMLAEAYSVYLFMPLEQTFSLAWLRALWLHLQMGHQAFTNGETAFIPTEIALITILTIILLLIELQIEYELVFFSTLIAVGYLLLLAVYNEIDFSLPVLAILSMALLFRLFINRAGLRVLLVGMLLVGSLFSAALFLPREKVERQLLTLSSPLRSRLNQEGFYHYFEQGNSIQTGISRTGFSENDEVLGGPLVDDQQILFEARQQTAHYWRVESKAVYTGKGWKNASGDVGVLQRAQIIQLSDPDYRGAFAPVEQISVDFYQQDSYLPLPYGNKTIDLLSGMADVYLLAENDRVDLRDPNSRTPLQMQWSNPSYTQEELREVSLQQPVETIDYLQLPEQLPQSVRDLAEELTGDQETLLEKVTAVQNYLKTSRDFRYSKMDAEVTPSDQDYVAHFLFTSQVGYCDNFSSAMTVLLRAAGIPARWAKGFAPGEVTDTSADQQVYTIRNQDAHSWVEVYFAGYGWLPFEPTPSFTQPQATTESSETETTESTTETSEVSTSSTSAETSTSSSAASEPAASEASFLADLQIGLQKIWRILRWLLLLLLCILIGRWYFYLLILLLLNISKQPLISIYPRLLAKMESRQPRPQAEPLLQYAQRVEAMQPIFGGDFLALTKIYENMLYGAAQTDRHTNELIKAIARKLSQFHKKL